MPLRLKYTRTSPDRDDDGIAWSPDAMPDRGEALGRVGRVMADTAPGKAQEVWRWFANGQMKNGWCLNGSGTVEIAGDEGKIAACEALEAYWFAALERLREQSRLPPVSRP